MSDLIVVGIAGFAAALVDGALGMGFGPTSSTLLLSAGLSPAATSTTVNIAKVVTGLASGAAHWRMRNIDRRLVLGLAGPGIVGALIGTIVLANVDGDAIRPVLAVLLMLVGLRILFRFSRPLARPRQDADGKATIDLPARPALTAVAATGGVTNGMIGAWGPVVTPYLLQHRLPPRIVVGSVNTAEIAVAVTAAGSLLGGAGGAGIDIGIILAMLGGGIVGAPLAAYVVRIFRPRLLGLAVAALLLVTQARELVPASVPLAVRLLVIAVILAAVSAAALRPPIARRKRQAVLAMAGVGSAGSPGVGLGHEGTDGPR